MLKKNKVKSKVKPIKKKNLKKKEKKELVFKNK